MLAEMERRRAGAPGGRVSEPITVMIAEDHEPVTRSLGLGLSREGDMAVIANAGELEASTSTYSVAVEMPRVLVLIVHAANGPSIELIRRLRAQAPAIGIVVLTDRDAPTLADALMDLGVLGYVLTDEAGSDLPSAIRSAANGVAYVSPPVADSASRCGATPIAPRIRSVPPCPNKAKIPHPTASRRTADRRRRGRRSPGRPPSTIPETRSRACPMFLAETHHGRSLTVVQQHRIPRSARRRPRAQ